MPNPLSTINMNPPAYPAGGGISPSSLQGPRPPPLKVSKESHKIKKPPLPPPHAAAAAAPHDHQPEQQRQPVMIYSVSPKVIHVPESDFIDVVLRLTGLSSCDNPAAGTGDVSLAAKLASIVNISPSEKERAVQIGDDDMMWMLEEGVELGQFPGQFKGGVSRIKAHVNRIQGKGVRPCVIDTDSLHGNEGVHNRIIAGSSNPQETVNALNSSQGTKMEACEFPKMEPREFPKNEESEGAFGTSTLTSSESIFLRSNQKIACKSVKSEFALKKSLMRIRDFISLLSSYPVALTINFGLNEQPGGLLYVERPLRYVEGLIPMQIIRDVEKGQRSIFTNDVIPEAILNLAADLAVHQLIQTLLSKHPHSIKYIRLSTRSDVEKRRLKEKIEAALKDRLEIRNAFHRTLSIDASTYQSSVENGVRQDVYEMLQLPTITEDNDISQTRLIEEEMSSKRYLVLLVDSDAEETLDPWNVGFSKAGLAGVVVLITTESSAQNKDELIMELDLEIRTKDHLLPWHVFCHIVGSEVVCSSSSIQTIAVGIVEECRGHLLAIVLVANWLKNIQDFKLWELALHKMCHTNPSYDIQKFQGHLSRVIINTFINIIWDGINKTQKHCLLGCLFIPKIKDGKVDYELMNDWISCQLVYADEAEHNLRELLDHSVLLKFEGTGGRYIRLPEDTYDILQSLYTFNPLFIKKSGLGLTEPPNTELWHSAVQIELADNKLSELPLSPNWLELRVLMLQGNADLTKIPPLFFVHMPLLRILDLSYTSVRELPSSFFNLEQLRELYLKGCECFMRLPPEIRKLQKLEKLDLEETQIIHLPKEFQELTNMQSLIFYFYEYRGKKNKPYSCSTIIPSGVISKLKGLKHLSIDVNPDDERWHENIQVILPEILGLECLKNLSLYIPQLELLKLLPLHIFRVDFRFIVGCHMQRIISSVMPTVDVKFKQSDCSLKFVKGADVPAEIKMILRHSKALYLDRHVTMKTLSEFEMMNLERLRVCILAECREMQTIVDGRHSDGYNDVLTHLLFLSVSHMKNLRSIWEGPTPPCSSFGMLKSLSLQSCPKLITLFSLDFLGNLSLLKVLMVKDCPKLSTLISGESSQSKVDHFLPKLRKLYLVHLPELISISGGLHIGSSLKEIGFYGCPKFRSFSSKELSCQELTVIKGESKWWKAIEWSKEEWGKTSWPSIFNSIFLPINEEADVMTQLSIYNDDHIDDGPGGSVDEPLQPTEVATPILKSSALNSSRSNFSVKSGYKQSRKNKLERRTMLVSMPQFGNPMMPMDDGYSWRKYGQKNTIDFNYPRSYYRCIHGNLEGCPAKKRVQRSNDNPCMFEVTYQGKHTCQVSSTAPSSVAPPQQLVDISEDMT